jgi:hypothetical protein
MLTERVNSAQDTGDGNFGLENSATAEGFFKFLELVYISLNPGIDVRVESAMEGSLP